MNTFDPEFKLVERLRVLFPEARFPRDVSVRQNEHGKQYVALWNLPNAEPSIGELEAVEIPEQTLTITAKQARLWLLSAGLGETQIQAAILNLPESQREAAKIEWEYSSEIHSNNTLVLSIASALGMSSSQLRAAFLQAATII